MTKRWISDAAQRRSKRYIKLHKDLQEYVLLKKLGKEPTKIERKKSASVQYHAQGEQ